MQLIWKWQEEIPNYLTLFAKPLRFSKRITILKSSRLMKTFKCKVNAVPENCVHLESEVEMWSLPDLKLLNEKAYKEKNKLYKCLKRSLNEDDTDAVCEYGHNEDCEGDLRGYLWYDIFSDDPKGIIWLCEKHDSYYGLPAEGYFYCSDCGRIMIENYTWEKYFTVNEDANMLCLRCAFERHINNEDNWLDSSGNIDFEHIRKLPHLLAVESTYCEKDLKFIGNVELDIFTGERITGFSSTSTAEHGFNEIKELIDQAIKDYGKCILIMDAVYQFAVSIGVYVHK